MTTLTCKDCEKQFDTDRDGASKHADTQRCPSCGETHTDAEVEAREVVTAADGGSASTVEIQLTITIRGVDDASDLSVSVDD